MLLSIYGLWLDVNIRIHFHFEVPKIYRIYKFSLIRISIYQVNIRTFVSFYCVEIIVLLGSLSNYDDDHNDDFKKTIGLMIKATALHVHHAF